MFRFFVLFFKSSVGLLLGLKRFFEFLGQFLEVRFRCWGWVFGFVFDYRYKFSFRGGSGAERGVECRGGVEGLGVFLLIVVFSRSLSFFIVGSVFLFKLRRFIFGEGGGFLRQRWVLEVVLESFGGYLYFIFFRVENRGLEMCSDFLQVIQLCVFWF